MMHFERTSVALSAQDAPGWQIVEAGLESGAQALGRKLVAAYALGSLAHGGFSSATSDVDLGFIVDALADETAAVMQSIRERVHARFGTPLSARLSLFWASWDDLQLQSGAGRFPLVDRIDLLEHGICLLGEDLRARVQLPAREQRARQLVLEGARFMLEKLVTPERVEWLRNPQRLVALGCREVTKAVLFPVRFLFTADTGRAAANPEAISHFLATRTGPARELVVAAASWRERGELAAAEQSVVQLSAGLLPLYRELSGTYAERMRQAGAPELAEPLSALCRALQPP
jgi:hypothetical protein